MGEPGKPFPGRATITLTGPPDSRELPLYGAKVVAVREGLVQMVGLPKVPSFTRLAASAAPGDTFITLDGEVNWAVGDTIAIASSSYFGVWRACLPDLSACMMMHTLVSLVPASSHI